MATRRARVPYASRPPQTGSNARCQSFSASASSPPVAPTMSASALFTLAKTPIASSARYSTAVATIATTKSTNDTANENFMTDHGSMRLRCSRARRGPRGAPGAPALAVRMASETRAVAAVPPGRTGAVAMPAVRMLAVGGRTLARATAGPGTTGAVALTTGGALVGGALTGRAADPPPSIGCVVTSTSGGGGMPGARVYFGAGAPGA